MAGRRVVAASVAQGWNAIRVKHPTRRTERREEDYKQQGISKRQSQCSRRKDTAAAKIFRRRAAPHGEDGCSRKVSKAHPFSEEHRSSVLRRTAR